MAADSQESCFSLWKEQLLGGNMIQVLNTMEEIVRDGDWNALGLLTIAGENITGIAKQLPITTAAGKLKFEEFRQDCIRRLQERLGVKAATPARESSQPRVFISYNHKDRESANALALELARAKLNVFLDHWEMAPHEEILPRIERELNSSDFVVALISPRSAASGWVRRELEIVVQRQEATGSLLLLPVLLEDCDIPEAIASRPYHDLRDSRDRPMVAQAILNQVFGIKPFSQRCLDFLSKPAVESPYTAQAQQNGRRLLQELAKHQEMELTNNQKWLLWEAFHRLLASYKCTLKMGRERSGGTEGYEFAIVDRWNEKGNSIVLTDEEFDRGLWQGEIDLLKRGTIGSDKLRFAGSTGRFSLNKAFNPNVSVNTAEATSEQPMGRVLTSFWKMCEAFDEGSKQCFLFDYQRLILPSDWHNVRVVVGSAEGGESLAFSPMIATAARDRVCAVFEVFDPFFASLKYTKAYKGQLAHIWEGDVDLMSPETEVLLGLA